MVFRVNVRSDVLFRPAQYQIIYSPRHELKLRLLHL